MALLWSCSMLGQFEKPRDITFEVSEPYKVVDSNSKNYFHRGNEVLSLKVVRGKTIVQKFDASGMKQVFSKELEMPKSYDLEAITEMGDKLLMLYSIWDRDRESEQLFYREIDFNTGTWKGAEKRIIATRGKIAGNGSMVTTAYFRAGVTDKFDFYYSADRSKMLVQYRKVPKVKSDAKNFDEIGLYVFDADMREIWGDEARMPYTEKKMNNIDYGVDSDGNAYILATVFDDNTTRVKKKGSDDEPNYHIEMLKRTPQDKRLETSEIELNGKFITSVSIYETVDDLMVLAGFYNNTARGRNADGVFYAKLNKEGELYDEQSYSIPVEIMNQYESKRTQKRNDKKEDKGEAEFTNLKLRKLQFLEDGSIILIGEQYYIVTHTSTTNGRTTTYYTYHYDDILISKIDPAGELAWMRKLPKSQYGKSGRGFMSFKHQYADGFHYFLYVDLAENLELPFDQAPRTYGDGRQEQLTAYIVDDERGEVTKEAILDMADARGIKLYQFATHKIIMISDTEFLFESYKKKKEDVMVKISLKE